MLGAITTFAKLIPGVFAVFRVAHKDCHNRSVLHTPLAAVFSYRGFLLFGEKVSHIN